MFPDEFWVQVAPENTFSCPFCTATVHYENKQRTGKCLDCMSSFHEFTGTPHFYSALEPHFDMMKVWAEKGELVIWIEKSEEKRRVLSEAFLQQAGKRGGGLNF